MHSRPALLLLAAAVVAAVLAACAGATPPTPASGPPEWTSVAGEPVLVIVTRDADGSPRETKLWIVVLDGQGFIRTGSTRWYRNIERDPDVELRIAGASHRLRAELVRDPELARRVSAALREKYGIWDRLIAPFRSGEPHILRLVAR